MSVPTTARGWNNLRLLLMINEYRWVRVRFPTAGGYIIRTSRIEDAMRQVGSNYAEIVVKDCEVSRG